MEVVRQPRRERKLKRWHIITLSIIGVSLLASVSILIFVNAYINKSLAQIEGELTIGGLRAPVEVVRDADGVPHIKAENEHDLFLAQGYVQAQDRMFQMDLARRQASGRLSEVAGEAALEQDKYFRTLGLRRAAEKSYKTYSEEAKQIMEWYADGVNAYMQHAEETNSTRPEFILMGGKPEPWTPIDSLTIGKYMAFDLGGHWERQAFNYHLLQSFPKEKALELFHSYPSDAPTVLTKNEMDIENSFSGAVIPHPFNGSNNWVVSGKKTKSGEPLLADDPHLGLATPSIWYQMHLESPEYNVSGVIFAGIPGIILGHNNQIAWGVTNTGPDVQQLYLEKRNPDNPDKYLFEGEWEQAKVIQEPIKVKDGETVPYEVIETRHGPIISDFAGRSGKDNAMSLRWTALDASTELEAILEINRASNWEEFEKGLEKFLVPAQNFVFAAKDGTIAYKANGKIPIYEEGDQALLPLEGWIKENEWKGFIPFDELPTTVNPDEGFIATANNKVVSESYPYHISNNWAQPYRYMRIAEQLKDRDNLTAQDMKELQMDQMNLRAREFVPIFLEHLPKENLTDKQKRAVALLKRWNYEDNVDGAAPLVYHKWIQTFTERLYEEAFSEEMLAMFKGQGQTTDELIRKADQGETPIWIKEQGGFNQLLEASLAQSVSDLSDRFGEQVEEWKWGAYHRVTFDHPLSSISFLERFFNGEDPIPVGGSRVTVMAASYNNESGLVRHGASWRFVVDAKDFSKASHIVGPGQAGHFRSDWYHDQRDDWVEGGYHTTVTEGYEGAKLVLKPE
ncbi:penicillin acylase family protein [Pontibacillus sp. HMF3514]|uniref:penicillin acylase family protein n=1 Tax=Pontibacillus sp. HMF3514 TaxID=2692425 RepID=UPI001320404F|nr:penicillin acylase family protein [Pontibacillus sp. HMF3514]QHE51926.1 penicillin acylase family protein [Pontibacillus sp. HMF3514]